MLVLSRHTVQDDVQIDFQDHRSLGYPDHVMTFTNSHDADTILEMRAKLDLRRDLKASPHGGRVVVIGSRCTVEIDA